MVFLSNMMVLVILLSVSLGSIASVSRLMCDWPRDGAFPLWFSYTSVSWELSAVAMALYDCQLIFTHISPTHWAPVCALWPPVFMVMIFALLKIASTAAFGTILAMCSLGLFTSYLIAFGCVFNALFRRKASKHGEWNLGNYGVAVNVFKLFYTASISIFLPSPSSLLVTGTDMYYAL